MGKWRGTLESLGLNNINPRPDRSFWSGKSVLVTGHTGFKGSWLCLWLSKLGANITGISLPPATEPSLYNLLEMDDELSNHYVDIRDFNKLDAVLSSSQPEIVIHLAAQALVRPGYRNPLATFETNVMGTANLLESIRQSEQVKTVVAITTDKVYLESSTNKPFKEEDPLGGLDPYSASKSGAEHVIASYQHSYFNHSNTRLVAARAGNVIGGGDWSEDRLVADAIRAWSTDTPLFIRKPDAIRPWQHVLEPLAGYLLLAERLHHREHSAIAYNFGPSQESVCTVRQIVDFARGAFPEAQVTWGDDSGEPPETDCLMLDPSRAEADLGLQPFWATEKAVSLTMQWYADQLNGQSAKSLCLRDLEAFGIEA